MSIEGQGHFFTIYFPGFVFYFVLLYAKISGKRYMILNFGMQHWGLKLYKVCINCDPGLTLTYFTVWSNLVT